MFSSEINLDKKLKECLMSFSNIDEIVKMNELKNYNSYYKNDKKKDERFNKNLCEVNNVYLDNQNIRINNEHFISQNYQPINNINDKKYYNEKIKKEEYNNYNNTLSIKTTPKFLTFGNNNTNINSNRNKSGNLFNNYNKNIKNNKQHYNYKNINFTFQPEINKNSILINKNLENKGKTTQKRLLKKKENFSPEQSIYFSENIHSPYYLNMSLIEKDKNKNVTPFIDLYERCRDKEMIKNEKIEKIKIELSNKDNFSFQPKLYSNRSLNYLNIEKKNSTNDTNKSTNNSSLANGNMTLNFKTNEQKIKNFLINNEKYINKKKRNISKLTKAHSEKEMKGITFYPNIKKNTIKDDYKNIIIQIPYVNDYILKRRSFIERKKRESEIEEYNNSHHLSVSKRRFINEENRPKTPDMSINNLRRFKFNNVLKIRKELGIEEFYSNNFSNDKNYHKYSFTNEDFKNAILNIKKINSDLL